MKLFVKNWSLNSYVTGTWTALVDAINQSLVKSVIITTGANHSIVRMRLVDSLGDEIARLVPEEELKPYGSYAFDVSLITLEAGQKLQIWSSNEGVSFSANGAAYAEIPA